MGGTKETRDWRRIERWFKSAGPMANVSNEAFDLLGLRLAARFRARLVASPLFVLAAAIFVSILFDFPSSFDDAAQERWSKVFASRALAAYALLAIATLVASHLTSRAERRIGAALARRSSRGDKVSLPMMLGRVRLSILVATITIEGALVVPLFVLGYGWFAWGFLAAYLGACALTALGVRQAATRTTIAMDPTSLAIDERLRSIDSFHAANPLSSIILAFPAVGLHAGPSGFILVWGFAGAFILVLMSLGMRSHPWHQPLRPLPPARSTLAGTGAQ
jgi:hypothetical protein